MSEDSSPPCHARATREADRQEILRLRQQVEELSAQVRILRKITFFLHDRLRDG